MARRYINQLVPGERIENQVFLIDSKDLRTTSQGALYIHAVLRDRTGQILARMWQASEGMYRSMPEGGFLGFTGRVESYKGSLQFIIDGIREAKKSDIQLEDFLPQTSRDIEVMFARVVEILGKIENKHLAGLMKQFTGDKALMADFRKSPAAIQLHHAYIGGLLEHTLSLLELALVVIPQYPQLSLDLMLAGIFLHDIGKTVELTYNTNFTYSDEGQLIGHIVQACLWVDQKALAVEQATGEPFPVDLKTILQHVILAHHGSYEFGSPRLPAIPEAIALHHLDNLDAKVHMHLREIASDPDPDSHWTQYVRNLETKIFKKDVLGTRARQ
jgi:3'-5' exoribonuclease